MKKLVSVIIPVYRTEKFLNQCICSVINQTYSNLEIILVDDGSPDRCPEICEEWKGKDNRIQVIHQKNGGGGKARNIALDKAKGDFILFVDSDDYISPIMIEFLLSQFKEDIDIVECSYRETSNDNVMFDDLKDEYNVERYSNVDAMRENIKDHIFRQLIWNKLYRKNVINTIRFPVGTKIDDEYWTYQVIGNARRLIYTDKVLYAYRQQNDSVMHSLDITKRLQAVKAKRNRYDYICKHMPELQEECIYNLWISCIYQGQLALKEKNEKNIENVWSELKRTLREYPIDIDRLDNISCLHKIWLYLAAKHLKLTCRIRNSLKVGL